MTIAEYNQELLRDIANIDIIVDGALRMAALSITAEVSERVFEKGLNGAGTEIGRYKTSAYIKKRQDRGLRTDRVTLEFTSDLKKDFENSVTKTDDGYAAGVKRVENGNKVRGNVERYGPIFTLSQAEEKKFMDVFTAQLMKRL
jgi:hypothetical protein